MFKADTARVLRLGSKNLLHPHRLDRAVATRAQKALRLDSLVFTWLNPFFNDFLSENWIN